MRDTSQLGTSIGRTVTFKGDIHSEEDMLIDGQVEGTLDLGQHLSGRRPHTHRSVPGSRPGEVDVQGVVNEQYGTQQTSRGQ